MSAILHLGKWQDTLCTLADGSVRLILTSPPYDNARTYEGTNEPVDFDELARFCLRVLCPGGVCAMVLDGAVNDGVQSVTPYRVVCEWAAMPGWRFLQMLAYGRQGMPGAWREMFRKDHEPLIVMVKDGAPCVCEKERLVERAIVAGNKGHKSVTRDRDGKMRKANSASDSPTWERKHRGSIWWYGNVGYPSNPSARTGHPATFAEAFARDAVDVWSNPGDLVCDPFAGSATVGRACIDLGRRFVGSERVPKYHAIGMQRLAQQGLFGLQVPA